MKRTLLVVCAMAAMAAPLAGQEGMDPSDCLNISLDRLPTRESPDYSFTIHNQCDFAIVVRWYHRKGNSGGDEWSERRTGLTQWSPSTRAQQVKGRLERLRAGALPTRLVVACAVRAGDDLDQRCRSDLPSRTLLGDLSRSSWRVGGS